MGGSSGGGVGFTRAYNSLARSGASAAKLRQFESAVRSGVNSGTFVRSAQVQTFANNIAAGRIRRIPQNPTRQSAQLGRPGSGLSGRATSAARARSQAARKKNRSKKKPTTRKKSGTTRRTRATRR